MLPIHKTATIPLGKVLRGLFTVMIRKSSVARSLPPVVDIDFENMMYDEDPSDDLIYPDDGPEASPLKLVNLDGAPLAPIDIDAWADDEELFDGTVEEDQVRKDLLPLEYPAIPKERSGIYEFKGLTVTLPKRMLRPETYRYRLGPEDANLPDDMQVCCFEKNHDLESKENN